MIISSEALKLLRKDEKLAPFLNANLESIKGSGDVYEGLIRSIVSQQLSVKAAATIYKRFLSLFESQYPTPSNLLNFDDATLRSAGLSSQKTKYVKNVAVFFNEHNLYDYEWSKLNDSEIIEKLTSIKGVGRWTVEMILMFTLDRPDILPLGDLGIQQAIKHIYKLQEEKKELGKKMEQISQKWKPHRSLACLFLWNYKDNPPTLT